MGPLFLGERLEVTSIDTTCPLFRGCPLFQSVHYQRFHCNTLSLPRAAHARARGYASKGLCDRLCPFIYISVCHHEKHEFSNYRQLLGL